MVRDLILDMTERDLSFVDKSDSSAPIFDSVWGDIFDEDKENDLLLCNIIVPESYWGMIKYQDDSLILRFKSKYIPDTRHFRIRPVAMLRGGGYSLFSDIRGDMGLQACSFAMSRNIASQISASALPFIDVDGNYIVKLVRAKTTVSLDKAYIYSAKSTDLAIDFSDDQAAQLLSLCSPGKSYRYPTSGVGIIKYLNSVVDHSDLADVLETQFDADSKPLIGAEFDNQSGKLDVLYNPEQEVSDIGLENIDDLNSLFFSMFDDEFVRRNIVLNEVSDVNFTELLDQYSRILGLFLFTDEDTSATRIANHVQPGCFDAEGNIIEDDTHYIVTATLDGGSIIMFDDKKLDAVAASPIFIINDVDETRLYTSLVEQPYWVSETCHKCFILKKRSTVRYMIHKERFRQGKGLYVVPANSHNFKNMLALAQDDVTGRLLGIVSNNTNINDIILEEVTQYIYASQLS